MLLPSPHLITSYIYKRFSTKSRISSKQPEPNVIQSKTHQKQIQRIKLPIIHSFFKVYHPQAARKRVARVPNAITRRREEHKEKQGAATTRGETLLNGRK